MPNLYRHLITESPGHSGQRLQPSADDWTEIARLDGYAYGVAESAPVIDELVVEPVEQTPALLALLVGASRRHRFLLARLAARRYEAETAGVTWSGWPVATDRTSQALLMNERQSALSGMRQDGKHWKFGDGFHRQMTNAQIIEMAGDAYAYWQACWDLEAAIADQIRSTLIPDESILHTAWPSNKLD